ncbi:MAG: mannonate dehydratase [Sporomusaceae bacterium]|nr:mannonate dehydratase [Sporomusaceae bacterium]
MKKKMTGGIERNIDMQMTMRWFGTGYDAVTLEQIRQVPGVTGVITTLYGTQPGEAWKQEDIFALKAEVEASGLTIAGIESVNIHDSIKVGSPDRDGYIDNYILTLERLAAADIRLICYNFMPVFDWTRSDLAKPRPDGSTVLAYDQALIDKINPDDMLSSMDAQSNGFILPGWEPERMARIKELFALYKEVDEEKLFANLGYFLKRIMPTCERCGIKMAIHPDDPAWPVFGLPRIVTNKEKLLRLIRLVDSPCNGVTLCSGSLGSNPANDIPDIIHALKGRIHFAHVRNLRHNSPGNFEEAAHLSSDGSLDIFQIMKALYDIGFNGPIRSDHGRAIWGEVGMPGYGLYDRALGAAYLNGLWESIDKMSRP